METRNLNVDFFKFLGTLLVILAHTGLTGVAFELRTFDVVMLVFASGLTLKYHGTTWKDYFSYVKNAF